MRNETSPRAVLAAGAVDASATLDGTSRTSKQCSAMNYSP